MKRRPDIAGSQEPQGFRKKILLTKEPVVVNNKTSHQTP